MAESASYDLFISYTDTDHAWVEGYLLDALTQARVRCYSSAAFALGAPQLLEFERAVRQSQRTLLVLSPAYLADGLDQFIDLLAQSYGLETATWPVIPLILHPCKLPPRLALLVALDATESSEWPKAIARLCAALQRPLPPPTLKPACPYPGMSPFSEANRTRFFGRDREVRDLIERLHMHPFVTIIGPSGAGKSSLVFAGLIPALRQSGLFGDGEHEWMVRPLRPGPAPIAALTAAVGDDHVDPVQAAAALLASRPADRLLLVVDQFEELFVIARQDVLPFQQALLRLAEISNCFVILTVRADFYQDLMASPLWQAVHTHRAEVLPLDADGLREAIRRPAEEVGVYVEGTLVERLVADAAGEPGVLPLVQETLVLLWERVQRRFLPLSAYDVLVLPLKAYHGMGSPRRTGLQVAMAQRADAALGDLTPHQQAIARRIFLRLVQFGEGRADTRRQQPVENLRGAHDNPDEFKSTLDLLTDNRLLTLSSSDDMHTPVVDIAHERLITGWPTFQVWVEEGHAAEHTRRQIERAAEEWGRHPHDSSYLYRGPRLAEALTWAAQNEEEITTDIQSFLAASRRRARLIRYAKLLALAVLLLLASLPPTLWVRDYLWRRDARGLAVTFVAGSAWLGSSDRAETAGLPQEHVFPRRRVHLSAFSIDLHEVTYRQYRLCVRAGRCSRPLEPWNTPFSFDTADERLPVVWVTAYQAADFCRWIGRRLPSEAEWERAARGTDGRPWPWGPEAPSSMRANLFFGPPERGPVAVDDPDFADGATPEGITHMLGNAKEWTRTPRTSAPQTSAVRTCENDPYDCSALWNGIDKVEALSIRGLSWLDGPAPVTESLVADPIRADLDIGFRCAGP